MRNFPRVPIFVEGDHKFGPWTATDVIAMAKNSSILRDIHKAPVVIGHEENQVQFFGDTGAPSFGYSQDMSIGYQMVKGQPKMALFADLKEVPDRIAALLHQGTYRRISPEIYKRLPSAFDGKVEGPVVKRIAILGGETPEIKDLNDVTNIVREQISADVFNAPRADTVLTFSDCQVDDSLGTAIAFCDVTFADFPPDKEQEGANSAANGFEAAAKKKVAGGDAAKLEATVKKKPATTMTPEAKAQAEGMTMSREELVQILAQMGFEVDTITPTIPESFLAHTVMLMRLLIEEAAAKSAQAQIQSVENEANAEEMAEGEPTDPSDPNGGMQPGDKPAPVGDSKSDPEGSPFQSNANAGEADMWQSSTKPKMPKKDEPATAAFTDQQTAALTAMISEAVNGALVKFNDSTTQKLTPLMEKIIADRKAADIAFCDSLVREGKVFPCEIDAGLPAFLSALNGVDVVKFDDGKEATLADKFKELLKARAPIKFTDRIANKISTTLDADKDELVRFCDENAEAIKAAGQTKEQYLASFEKAKAADPTLTARKYLFPNQAA